MKHSKLLFIAFFGVLLTLAVSTKIRRESAKGPSLKAGYGGKSGSGSGNGGKDKSDNGSSKDNQNDSGNSGNNGQNLLKNLLLAPSALARYDLLSQDSDFTFNFLQADQSSSPSGKGGNIILASRESFPAVTGLGVSMAIGFLGPCGMNTPHLHPRATEFNYVVNGSLLVGFIAESGARQIINTVPGGTGTIFPKAAIHWLANLGCDPVVFVGALNNEDPGVAEIGPNLFSIQKDVLSATLGDMSSDQISQIASQIPSDVALGLETCRKQCGL